MKDVPTRPRVVTRIRQRQLRDAVRDWLNIHKEAAANRHVAVPESQGGNGITRIMRAITPPEPEYVARHEFPPGSGGKNTPYRRPTPKPPGKSRRRR